MGWSGSPNIVAHKHHERRATRPYTCFSGRGSPLYSTSYRFCCSPFTGCVLLLVLYSAFESNAGICKTSICPLQIVGDQLKLDIIAMSDYLFNSHIRDVFKANRTAPSSECSAGAFCVHIITSVFTNNSYA